MSAPEARTVPTVTVWQETKVRNGVRICHLFDDCSELFFRDRERVTLPDDASLAVCKSCIRFSRHAR